MLVPVPVAAAAVLLSHRSEIQERVNTPALLLLVKAIEYCYYLYSSLRRLSASVTALLMLY